jgi:hypothetical protein
MLSRKEIEEIFTNISGRFEIDSDADEEYNCVSWSMNDTRRYWWPCETQTPFVFWPEGVPCEETLDASIF